MPDETEESNSFLEMELEALKSIYIDELIIENNDLGKPSNISIDLFPATADNVDEQYVRITLIFNLSDEYPEILPEIKIRNPRGLSDDMLNRITEDLDSRAIDKKGNSMLYELIEAAKEHLTTENRPSGQCAICLYGFSDTDVFTRTECFHYFHSHCLSRYSSYIMNREEDKNLSNEGVSELPKRELLCPMCRIPMVFRDIEADYPPPSSAEEDTFAANQEMCELQKKMADLYQKQIEKGGIIDIEAEKNKYLLEISNVPTSTNTLDKSGMDSKSVVSETSESTLQEAKAVSINSTEREIHTDIAEGRPKSHGKPVPKHRYKQSEERHYNRNNKYDRRFNDNARDYHQQRYDHFDDSRSNRKPRFSERNHNQLKVKNQDLNSESNDMNESKVKSHLGKETNKYNNSRYSRNHTNHAKSRQENHPKELSDKDLNTESNFESSVENTAVHSDSETHKDRNSEEKHHYLRDRRHNPRTRHNQKHMRDNLSSEPVPDNNEENLAFDTLVNSDSENKHDDAGDTAAAAKRFQAHQSRDQKHSSKTRHEYPSHENNYKDRAQYSYDYNSRQQGYRYQNNRPPRYQRRNYQTNHRYYQQDDDRNAAYSQKSYPDRSNGYYPKPNRYNSRNNRFNETNQQPSSKNSSQTDVPQLESNDAADYGNEVSNESQLCSTSDTEVHVSGNVPNRARSNMHRSGNRYPHNSSQFREPGHYNKREPAFLKNRDSHYDSPRRNKRDFQYNSRSSNMRNNQEVPQDYEQIPSSTCEDKRNPKFSENKLSAQLKSNTQEVESVALLPHDQPKSIQNDAPAAEVCHSKPTGVAIGDATQLLPDLHNSCNFPLMPPQTMLPPPPGFANPTKKVIYGLSAANPPPGFNRS